MLREDGKAFVERVYLRMWPTATRPALPLRNNAGWRRENVVASISDDGVVVASISDVRLVVAPPL